MNNRPKAGSMKDLTAARVLRRNTIWNVAGESAPVVVAVIAVPVLIHALGTARFGILTIIWMLIGYLGLFDLGTGRALTNLAAQRLGKGEESSLPPLIWTAGMLMAGLGVIAAILLAMTSHWIVYSVLRIPLALKPESLTSLYILGCALPAVILSSGFRGVLEAYQRFDAANAVRVPMGVFSFAGPLAVLPFSHSLVPVVAVLAVGRYLGALSYLLVGRRLLPVMRSAPQWDSALVRPLLTFGGWMTASTVTAPLMSGMDRFYLGALVSMQAVAYYATPFDVVTKLFIIPYAVSGVLFPAFSTTLVSDPEQSRALYRRAWKLLALAMAPMSVVLILFAKIGLKTWIGPTFAARGAPVVQVLAVGVFVGAIAQPAFSLVLGAGRADWTGKMNLAQLPFYLGLFWVLTLRFGIVGTAAAWLIRTVADTLVLFLMANKLLYPRATQAAETKGPVCDG